MSRMRLGVSDTANSGFISTPHGLCTAAVGLAAATAAGSTVVVAGTAPTTVIGALGLAAGLYTTGEFLVDEDQRVLLKNVDFQFGKKEAEAVKAPAN